MTPTKNIWFKLGTSPLGAALLHHLGVALSFAWDEADNIEMVAQQFRLPRLSRAFHQYRLVQISDIHLGSGMTPERLAHIIDLVNAQQPELVVITGDFVTTQPIAQHLPALQKQLSRLRARDGVMAVLGNHDHHCDPLAVRQMLVSAGVVELPNRHHTVVRGAERLHIAGVDDHYFGEDRMDEVLEGLPADGCAILLAHEPDYADISAATGRFDLQLSGHSHAGQIAPPGLGMVYLPKLCRKYPVGRYQLGRMIQYTNRGLGTVILKVRIGARPEITTITLESPEAA
jgi:predicted MPP superfamily phosphohydrolase